MSPSTERLHNVEYVLDQTYDIRKMEKRENIINSHLSKIYVLKSVIY